MTPIFTPDEELAICERYKAGENMRQIADTVFCDPVTISNILRRRGYKARSNHRPDHVRQAIIDLYKRHPSNGNRCKIVAEITGLTAQQVYDAVANAKRSGRL